MYLVGLSAGLVFAISGALAAAERNLDIVSFMLIGTVTGIGGGTLRDLILDAPVFWIGDTLYLWGCLLGSVATYFFNRFIAARHSLLVWMDAVGMALFCVAGTAKALSLGVPPIVAVTMGVITPTFGSLLRDVILNQNPVLLGPEIYVTACALGALVYLGLHSLGIAETTALLVAMGCALGLRGAAIIWDLRLPKFA
ncbi:trimeric intracellular cation channel family protein [Exilibacterium tricleocarpae]|uniref:Trimeric intracellular cation channel family protein n=2 Tax=Exilibacterium tricleocarpae TaxID=2591008 RepID=A0A545SNG4_9GAMM|nr:trimeric intracellular cation channel family protein [Exilibacterium tricleocarpae]